MRLFTTVAALRCYISTLNRAGKEVGFVPTMGALHPGHLSLIERARRDNTIVVVSIFVNPLQFGPNEDFNHYPRTLEQDAQLCEAAGVDVLFAPSAEEIGTIRKDEGSGWQDESGFIPSYSLPHLSSLTQVIPPVAMTSVMCGRSRSGHFQGVATIVTKLLNIVQPDSAYFGQKDAQQLAIIKQLVKDLNLPVQIVGCPIVREDSGLAYSSRNQYLSVAEKEQAQMLYRSLQKAQKVFRNGDRTAEHLIAVVAAEMASVPGIELEYVELVDPVTLKPLEHIDSVGLLAIAARVGSTRLIDNLLLRDRQPIVAIDGPAGAGKSTVARQVAQRLELLYLDTGAMYRALTWLILQSGISVHDEPAVAELASQCEINLGGLNSDRSDAQQTPSQVWINRQNVTQEIRSVEVTANVSAVAAQPAVRRLLVKQQQRYGRRGGLVAEGRDIGTHVFPDAELKIFLTASVQERARRRQMDFQQQGQSNLSLEQLEYDIAERDRKDSTRVLAPLRKAADAIEIQTDGLQIEEVTERIVQCYEQRFTANLI